jgi:hypothetical protein
VGELQTEYDAQIRFSIIPPAETKTRTEEINGFGFEAQLHGLVAFDSEGNAVAKLPGHNFGKEEIRGAIEKVLAE